MVTPISTTSSLMNTSGSGNLLRIVGLASGLDVDTMVSKLMSAEKIPLNKLNQKLQTLQWQRDDYRSMNSQISDFRSNKLLNYRLEGTYMTMKTSISGNTSAISATASPAAPKGTTTVQVNTLAVAASKWSVADIRSATDKTFDPNIALGSQQTKLAGTLSQSVYNININGTQVTINRDTDSLNDVINNINKNTNVSAFYDSQTGKISFTAKQTGLTNGSTQDQAYITFQDDGGFLQNVLQIDVANNTASDSVQAVNADLVLNGVATTRTSNAFTVNGVSITLLQQGGSASTITTSTDTDQVVQNIKNFISDYNSTLDTVYNKINETHDRNYMPLSDEQKQQMSDNSIQAWEAKAKSGLLHNDSDLSQAYNNMRLDISTPVNTGNSKYTTLSSIGIQTGSYTEHGKLYLTDESKLRAAIENDPQAVASLFTATPSVSSDRSNMGIAQRLNTDLQTSLDYLNQKAGSAFNYTDNSLIGKDVRSVSQQIDAENQHLTDLQDRYYKQFTALETAMNQYNNQSTYLANAFK